MSHEVTITFFRVSSCGYYERKPISPTGAVGAAPATPTPTLDEIAAGKPRARAFGSLGPTLMDLIKWSAAPKSLTETQTYVPHSHASELPVFLAEITPSNNSCLLTLWNQTHDGDGIPSLLGTSSVGNAQMELSEVKAGHIPGFATYFWFIPQFDVVATVMVGRKYAGLTAMQDYVKGFLRQYSKHAVKDDSKPDAKRTIFSYRKDAGSPLGKYTPAFRVVPVTKAADLQYLIDNADSITKMYRRDEFSMQNRKSKADWQHLLSSLSMGTYSPNLTSTRLTLETDIQVTSQDVSSIIDEWKKNNGSSEYSDYGFRLQGESQPRWLSGMVARDEFTLRLNKVNPQLISGPVMLTALEAQAGEILKLLSS